MSDNKEEPKHINWINEETKILERLGINYEAHGVDPENVEPFAKILRIIGLSVVVIFVSWGLAYDWTSSRGPFEQFFKEMFGYSAPYTLLAYVLGGVFMIFGWRYRFIIGATVSTIFFNGWDIIKKFTKSI